MNRDDIETLACDLVHDIGATAPPIDLRLAAAACDVIVRVDPRMPDAMDGLVIPGWSRHLICVNGRRQPSRRRFSVSHEIGHLFLHCAEGAGCLLSPGTRYYELTPEREANLFAAMLLMPPAWVRADFEAGLTDPRALARRYNVSPPAMRFQLHDLSLLDAENGLPDWTDRPVP